MDITISQLCILAVLIEMTYERIKKVHCITENETDLRGAMFFLD